MCRGGKNELAFLHLGCTLLACAGSACCGADSPALAAVLRHKPSRPSLPHDWPRTNSLAALLGHRSSAGFGDPLGVFPPFSPCSMDLGLLVCPRPTQFRSVSPS